MRYGMWGTDAEEVGCTAVACFFWLGLGALFSTAFLRVYRYHDVLVKHSGVMWPVVFQVSGRSGLVRAVPVGKLRVDPCAGFGVVAGFSCCRAACSL